jgi:spoIIIJ-associated protein
MQLGDYVQRLLAHAGVPDADVTVDYDDDAGRHWVQIDVSDEDSGVLIGYHGETLAALQRINNLAFYDSEEFTDRITLNINDYREERREKLEELTREKAYHVLETGNPYTFSYMPANERYLVHTFLSEEPDFAELESTSEGRGRQRLLTIQFKATDKVATDETSDETSAAVENDSETDTDTDTEKAAA